MARTTKTTSDRGTAEDTIRRRAQQAEANFEAAKAKFTESFATNPKYAIEWHAEKVARAQVHFEWWKMVADVLEHRGLEDAIRYAAERVEMEVDSFFGSNSTSIWKNAVRRAEAEVYNSLGRREMPELRTLAESR